MVAGLRMRVPAMAWAVLLIAGCASTRLTEHASGYVDDAAITSRVKSEIAADKDVDAATITVETSGGTVVLSGFVRSPLERQTAESIAMKIKGVSLVRNEISVRP